MRYFQFRSQNLDAQSAFLSALFEWDLVVEQPERHVLFDHGGPADAVQGDIEAVLDGSLGLIVYWDVDSVEDTCAKTTELGGRIVMPPTELADSAGYVALIEDPDGNTLGLYQSPTI